MSRNKTFFLALLFIVLPILGEPEMFIDNIKTYCIRKALTEGNQYNISRNGSWIVECVHYYPDSVRLNAIMYNDTVNTKYIKTIYASDKNIFKVEVTDAAVFRCDHYPYFSYQSWGQSLDTIFIFIKGSHFNKDETNWEVFGIDISFLRLNPTNCNTTQKNNTTKYLNVSNYPDPFSSTCTINCFLPESNYLSVNIYNTDGKLIRVLGQEWKRKGQYSIYWDGTDNNNQKLANGRYYYQVISGRYIGTRKMVLLK